MAASPFSFKAFLGHRYKSPAVNLHFFRLFSEIAEMQFEVDAGSYATNVTRLERMIRGSDAFVGIYPFDGDSETQPSREELLHASRYFRLELDLAIRSQKPALVLYDNRYRNLLPLAPSMLALEFDPLEVASAGGFPNEELYRRAFRSFCETVAARKAYELTQPRSFEARTTVALLVPGKTAQSSGYPAKCVDRIRERLAAHRYDDVQVVALPAALDRERLMLLQEVDFAVADVGDATGGAAVVAYLHGSFVPTMRLRQVARGDDSAEPASLERALYASTEAGYLKDVVRWSDLRSLEEGLEARLTSLDARVKRLNTVQEAESYFRSASLRKEAVFLSYSGRDADFAVQLSTALKLRFQLVFDYRDGESIQPGKPWIEEIFSQLSTSAIGIPLLSEHYLASGNCRHEAHEMIAQRDAGSMQIIPMKISADALELPAFLQDTQYLRCWEHDGAEQLIEAVLRALDSRAEQPQLATGA